MDLVPKTLEEEFEVVTSEDSPQQGSPKVREGSSKKRRLGITSKEQLQTAIRQASPQSPQSKKGWIHSEGTTHAELNAKIPVSFEGLSRENSRLRFEVDNAKSLQKVLERNILSLQEQLVAQKSVSPPTIRKQQRSEKVEIPSNNDAKHSDIPLQSSLNALIAEKDETMRSLEIMYQDRLSRLNSDLRAMQDERHVLMTENSNLKAEIETLHSSVGTLQVERNALREQVVQLESDGLRGKKGESPQPDALEIKILNERLEKAEAEAAQFHQLEGKLKEYDTILEKLQAAQSRVRCLEKVMHEQDDLHTSFLEANNELEKWKSLFSHIAKDITPEALYSHMQSLENSLSRYQQFGKGSELKDTDLTPRIDLLNKNVAMLESENLALRKQIKQMDSISESKYSTQLQSLKEKILVLQDQLGSGYFNDETTKILHMKRNPYHDEKLEKLEAQITRIEAENATLQNRIKNMGGSDTLMPAQSELKMAQMEGEIKMLRKKITDVQKASERLKQVFMRQISMLRESVPKIFGYQLEMVSDPNKRDCKALFTLSPQGAHSNSKIIFKLLGDGKMELVENEFTKRYSTEIETFINKFKSIPGFIANMTLDNFQRQGQS